MPPKRPEPDVLSKPRLGISACLRGERVRYDGGHKWSRICEEKVAPFVEFESICPESAIGMPTPRPPIDLFVAGTDLEVRGKYNQDLNPTARLKALADRTAEAVPLDGYILMQRSPSCALNSAKVYDAERLVHDRGMGMFAAQLRRRQPDLLMVEEQCLGDQASLFAFLCGVHVSRAWRLAASKPVVHVLRFHRCFGYLCAGYSGEDWVELDRLAHSLPASAATPYAQRLTQCLKQWLEQPESVRDWLARVQRHFEEVSKFSITFDTLPSLHDRLSDGIPTQLERPQALPFFATWL